ncbi:MAG: aminoacyl-histidine dipeptidase [Rikenellaceae bacterium]
MLENLTPKLVWQYFEEITKVPRPSKKEAKILDYLKQFAKDHLLDYKQDEIGNIVIYAPATHGYEGSESVILQSHVDMVCEKDSTVDFDFENDSIDVYIEDGWVKARGTTLGADCGIGMAVAMALLTDKEIQHPPIEALFTVDEETGLTGAKELDFSMLSAKQLINLDSEDEGELFVGCAGGIDTIGHFELSYDTIKESSTIVDIVISGLTGGHSGDDINKQRANGVVLMNRFLYENFNIFNINLIDIDAGALRNAIPREARVRISVDNKGVEYLSSYFEKFKKDIKNEYHRSEPDLNMTLKVVGTDSNFTVIDREVFLAVITSIFTLPCGVMAMSQDVEGFVETSTNIASVKIANKNIEVTTSQRSSVDSKKEYVAAIVSEVFEGCGAEVEQSDGYPGWTPNLSSQLLAIFKDKYLNLFGKEIEVKAVHAGLECGLFSEKADELNMVSVGPTVRNAHSPQEKLEIESVDKFWKLMVSVMQGLK